MGTQAFWRHEFLVTPDVLIPRPETELAGRGGAAALAGRSEPVVVDVGTGSGCIALSLAAERPDADVHAIDISPAALAVARANADRLGLAGPRALPRRRLAGARGGAPRAVDLVVSNPPYVDPADRQSLAPEVRDGDPALALFPPDGPTLSTAAWPPRPSPPFGPGGGLIVEIGAGMAAEVARLVEAAGFAVSKVRPDLQGIPRALVARRS